MGRRVFDAPIAFRTFVDFEHRRNSRWRGKLRALRGQPLEPYEMTFDGYWSIVGATPHRLGSA